MAFSCSSSPDNPLATDPTIGQVFNKAETEDLTKLLAFFEEHICAKQSADSINIASCYPHYFDSLKKAAEEGNVIIGIPFDRQRALYEQISQTTFQEIWEFGKRVKSHTTDTLRYLTYRQDGKFVAFLKRAGSDNDAIKNYYETLRQAGDIAPSMRAALLINYPFYNLQDISVRLMLAIHYLTLNDQILRHEKYE